MVLIKIFFLFLATSYCYSQTKMQQIDLLYKNDEFESVISKIEDMEEDRSYSSNFEANEYMALSKEKIGENLEAIQIYLKLISNRFRGQSSKFIRGALKGRKFAGNFKDSYKMIFYYKKIATLYTKEFEKLNHTNHSSELLKYEKKSKMFVLLLRHLNEENNDQPELLNNRIETHLALLESFEYNTRFYPFLSMISWQHIMKFQPSGAASSEVLSTSLATCTGLGISFKNKYYDWNIENCYLIGSANGSVSLGTSTYNQNGVGIGGMYGGAGVMFDDLAQDLSVGINLNYLYSKYDYDVPVGATLSNTDFFRFGYTFRSRYNFDNFGFTLSLGKIFENKSSIFQLMYGYYF